MQHSHTARQNEEALPEDIEEHASHDQRGDPTLLKRGVSLDEAVTWMIANEAGLNGRKLASSGADGQHVLKLLRATKRARDPYKRRDLVQLTRTDLSRLTPGRHCALIEDVTANLQAMQHPQSGPSINPDTGLQEFFFDGLSRKVRKWFEPQDHITSPPPKRTKSARTPPVQATEGLLAPGGLSQTRSHPLNIQPILVEMQRRDDALRDQSFDDPVEFGQGAGTGLLSRVATIGMVSGTGRESYRQEVHNLKKDDYEKRSLIKRKYGALTPKEVMAFVTAERGDSVEPVKGSGRTANQTNPVWNKRFERLGKIGKGAGALGLVTAGADIATSENPTRSSYANTGAAIGGNLLGLGGATIGSSLGVGGTIGGSLLGSTAGGKLGYSAGEKIYNLQEKLEPYYVNPYLNNRWTPLY